MNFIIWLEAKYTQDVIQKIKNDLMTNHYANVWMDQQGNIIADYPSKEDSMSRNIYKRIYNSKVSIRPEDKTIDFQMFGDKALPSQKKLIKFLLDNGIIDNTWQVEGGRKIGEYVGYNYMHFGDPNAPQNISDVKSLGTLSPAMQHITLYHGTSSYDWEKIQKAGALYPLFTGSNKEYGHESRFKHEHNKNLLYLATNIDTAWNYAKTRSRSVNKKLHPEDWKWTQHSGAGSWTIHPVLLRVFVPDISKLRSDDDSVNARMRQVAQKLWDQKSPEDQQRIMQDLTHQSGFEVKDPSMAQMLWRDTDEGFTEILAKLNPRIYRSWLASILKTEQVAYKGFIPLKFIKEVPIFEKEKK